MDAQPEVDQHEGSNRREYCPACFQSILDGL